MSAKPKREEVFGDSAGVLTRAMSGTTLLIALAILGLPQMRFLTGRLAFSLGLIKCRLPWG